MADPKIKLKRSAVAGKIPTPDQLPLGEVALNTYDGYLYASKNVGVGTTVIAVNPIRVGAGTDSYNAFFTQGNLGLGTDSPTSTLDVAGTLNVTGVSTFGNNVNFDGNITTNVTIVSTDAGSAAAPEFKLYRNSASPADADYLGQIKFAGESDTGVERNYAKITGKIGDATNGTEDGIIEFAHIKAGSQNISGRWNSTTLQLLNGTELSLGDSQKIYLGNDNDTEIYWSGTQNRIDTKNGPLRIDNSSSGIILWDDANTNNMARFDTGGSVDLYHNGDLKFETTGYGVTIFGTTETQQLNVTGVSTISTLKIGTIGNTLVGITTILDEDDLSSDSATALATQQSIKAYVDSSVTGAGDTANVSTSTLVVVGVSTFQGNVSIAGTLTYEDVTNIDSIGIITARNSIEIGANSSTTTVALATVESTKTSTSADNIDTFAKATYRSAQYQIQVTRGTEYHVTTLNIVHDGTDAYLSEFGTIKTGSSLATFDADISGSLCRVRATPSSATSTVFKIYRTLTKV